MPCSFCLDECSAHPRPILFLSQAFLGFIWKPISMNKIALTPNTKMSDRTYPGMVSSWCSIKPWSCGVRGVWSRRELSQACVWVLSLQLVALFWKAVELLGGGSLLEEVGYRVQALRFDGPASLPIHALLLDYRCNMTSLPLTPPVMPSTPW